MKKTKVEVKTTQINDPASGNSRRSFLKMGGLAVVGSSLFLYACSDDDDLPNLPPPTDGVFELGSGDVGILNYAYALEQLEAAFYGKVLAGSYWSGAEEKEKQVLQDLYNHEVIHREFYKTAIGAAVDADKVLPELEFDFNDVDFSSRDSVLQTAKTLEDTGVAAYNGAGQLIDNPTYLLLAGKIVSVEARHASAIRDLLNPGSTDFAGDDILVDLEGSGKAYDKETSPSDILSAVGATGFITTEFTAKDLPTA